MKNLARFFALNLKAFKVGGILLTLQIAIIFAVISNLSFLIGQRLEPLYIQSGLQENEVAVFRIAHQSQYQVQKDKSANDARLAETLENIAALDQVQGAAMINTLPLGQSGWLTSVKKSLTQDVASVKNVAQYIATQNIVKVLGLVLLEGRDFLPSEHARIEGYLPVSSSVIITKDLADTLFPDSSAVGNELYIGDKRLTIVGVVARLIQGDMNRPDSINYSLIMPAKPHEIISFVVIRTPDGVSPELLQSLTTRLSEVDDNQKIDSPGVQSFGQVRDEYFKQDTIFAGFSLVIGLIVVITNAFGIVGLITYYVMKREKEFAIRQSIGAAKMTVFLQLQVEFLCITLSGAALGLFFAIGLNSQLMSLYELSQLPYDYLLRGLVIILIVSTASCMFAGRKILSTKPMPALKS